MNEFALVGSALALIGTIISSYLMYAKRTQEFHEEFIRFKQEVKDTLQSVDEKLDEHNHYAKKFDDIKQDITVIKKDIEYLKK